jgi:hypothetical protein
MMCPVDVGNLFPISWFKDDATVPYLAIMDSLDTLNKAVRLTASSERGHHALCNFWRILNEGGTGLDSDNWQTMVTIAKTCRDGGVSHVLRALEENGCAGKSKV